MKMHKWTRTDIPSQQGRIAVVTGANSGIGFETALELARKGATVVLACRSETRGSDAADAIRREVPDAAARFMRLDLADLEQVRVFAKEFEARHEHLDILINNAGVMVPPQSQTKQGFELQFGVNHLGHFALTGLLLPRLLQAESARVVNVSSLAHRGGSMNFDDLDFRDRGYRPIAAYGQSKLANLLFSLELAKRLGELGSKVKVASAHPGWTKTNLQKHSGVARFFNPLFGMKQAQGALPTLRAATDPEVESGDFFGPHGFSEMAGYPAPAHRSAAARNEEDAARLWEISRERTGVTFEALAAPKRAA